MLKKLKGKKGISLIVLVITIIVIVILSVTIINMIIGKNGIINQANRATYEHETSREKEQIKLSIMSVMLDELDSNLRFEPLEAKLHDSWNDITTCEQASSADVDMDLLVNSKTNDLKGTIDGMVTGGQKNEYMKVNYESNRSYYVSLVDGQIIDPNNSPVEDNNNIEDPSTDDEEEKPEIGPVGDGKLDPTPGILEKDATGNLWIYSIEDLVAFSYNVNSGNELYTGKTVKLGRDLDFSGEDSKSYRNVFASYKIILDENSKLIGYIPASGSEESSRAIQELMTTGFGFAPIGGRFLMNSEADSVFNSFQGTFDGNYHTLKNFYQNFENVEFLGFFGYSNSDITIKNLKINGNIACNITDYGSYYTGGIIGYSVYGITLKNLEMNGNITCNIAYEGEKNNSSFCEGGIIGYATSGGSDINVILENCKYIDGNINVVNSSTKYSIFSGGIMGQTAGVKNLTINSCKVDNSTINTENATFVSGIVSYIPGIQTVSITKCCLKNSNINSENVQCLGGIVGMTTSNETKLDNNYVLQSNILVTTTDSNIQSNVGGIVGFSPTGTTTVENCYVSKSVINASLNGYVGGIAGHIMMGTNSTLKKCYVNDFDIQGGAIAIGGIAGLAREIPIEKCSATGKISANAAGGVGGIVGDKAGGKITECISSVNITSNATKGVTGIMGYCSGASIVNIEYCLFNGEINNYAQSSGIVGDFLGGQITLDHCINKGKLASGAPIGGIWIDVGSCSSTMTINNCANYSDISDSSGCGGIVGSGSSSGALSINNCYNYGDILSSGTSAGGIIQQSNSFRQVQVTNTANYGNVTGGITGGITGHGLSNMTNCYNYGKIKGDYPIGGLQGNGNGTIINCHNKGIVEGGNITGGIRGTGSGDISNSSNTGEIISSAWRIGGIVGDHTGGSIDSCFNDGKITPTAETGYIGGILAGTPSDEISITNCYNTSDLDGRMAVAGITTSGNGIISNCYNTGKITGTNSIGGIAAQFSGIISNCLNSGEIDCANNMINDVGGIIGNSMSGTVLKCYNIGNIINGSDAQEIGGVVGRASEVVSSYNSGNLVGNHIGGVAGYVYNGNVTNSHNEGSLTLIGSTITEYYAYMGQILGYTDSRAGEGCTYYSENDVTTPLDMTNGATKVNSKIMTMDFILGKLNEYASENSGLKSWQIINNIPGFSI